jgi:1-pyrroline-5-carboxylate dehydrogenase
VVMKPPSPVPYPPYLVARIMLESGVPGGAINFLAGPGSVVGESLVKNPGIAGIVFTGSKEVGYHMLREALLNVPRPVIAEMGGKNPIIVTENADIKKAVEGVVSSAFGYGGQKCSACSRLYLQETVFDDFMSRFVARVREIRVGDPSDRDVFMGPIIYGKAYDDFQRYSTMAREGGQIEVGGEVIKGDMRKGFFVRPTVVTGLPEDHFLVKNELFLPFLCVQRFRDFEEALNKANDVEYGLTAGIFSESEEEISRFFTEIQAGVVYSNRARGGSTGAMVGGQPFGGWKGSGSTGKGAGGLHYLIQFMREQSRTECG